jgi:hypothetical protein
MLERAELSRVEAAQFPDWVGQRLSRRSRCPLFSAVFLGPEAFHVSHCFIASASW